MICATNIFSEQIQHEFSGVKENQILLQEKEKNKNKKIKKE